ncbi:1-acyl-sn-glycerol-3-phosphate acyltransferase [Sulfurimonas sp. MAG313]|nr:lysophospholipid acyltransferase family protein [Sulfurimonas sp. MAG313]MDF1881571.1 1-acyl-sn-glycerol-3-phosphate acyltransferase [Sulfurimonas sp. MAG313]
MKIFANISFYYAATIIFLAVSYLITFFKLLPKPFGIKISSGIVNKGLLYKMNVFGTEDEHTQMFILNHQSGIDIPVMEGCVKANLAWVAKQELFDMPWLGLGVKLPDDIPLQRGSKTAIISLIKDCKDRIEKGRVVTIFPEGTRSKDERIQEFKPGAKMVADKLKLRVQPVVLVNTAKTFDSGKRTFYPFRELRIVFLDAFEADRTDKQWLNNTQIQMQKIYDEHSKLISHR